MVAVLVEVGVRLEAEETVCSGKEDCEAKNPELEPGVLYEVEVQSPKGVRDRGEAVARMYEAIKAVREKYPGVIITYMGIADSGDRLIVQMLDDPGWQIIVILALIAVILFEIRAWEIVDVIVRTVKAVTEEEDRKTLKILAYATVASITIASLGYLIGQAAKLRGRSRE